MYSDGKQVMTNLERGGERRRAGQEGSVTRDMRQMLTTWFMVMVSQMYT